jgi:Protein of unknown function (DUF3105)
MAETRKSSPRERAAAGGRDRKGPARQAGASTRRQAGSAKQAPGARAKGGAGRPVRGAAARRAAEKRRRQRTLLYSLVTVAVLGALVAFVIVANREEAAPTEEEYRQEQAALAPARQAAGCTEIGQLPNAGGTHIADNAQPSNWNSNPPTSGDHTVTSLPGGFYQVEQDERQLLHSLEHGYVAIQYKNLPADQVARLRELQREFDGRKLIVMPYSALDRDGLAISAWRHLQACTRLDVALARSFIDNYMVGAGTNRSVAPEPFAQ